MQWVRDAREASEERKYAHRIEELGRGNDRGGRGEEGEVEKGVMIENNEICGEGGKGEIVETSSLLLHAHTPLLIRPPQSTKRVSRLRLPTSLSRSFRTDGLSLPIPGPPGPSFASQARRAILSLLRPRGKDGPPTFRASFSSRPHP